MRLPLDYTVEDFELKFWNEIKNTDLNLKIATDHFLCIFITKFRTFNNKQRYDNML
jgi:hypothetical protein